MRDMRRWRISRGLVLMASMLLEQACLFKKAPPKASIVIPPAPQPQAPKPMAAPPQLPAEITTKQTVTAEGLPTLPPPVEALEAPKPVKPRPSRKTGQTANPVEAHTTPPVAEPHENPTVQPGLIPNPEPSLQPILGSREIQERTRRIQSYLEKARLTVLRAERSNPNGVQKELIAQVRTFLQQAEDARRVDLARAENLAERAEVLSRGLKR